MCSWQCGGCGKWYSYAVLSCDCSKYLHIDTSTGGSVPTPTNTCSPKLFTSAQVVDALEGCRDLECALELFRGWE